MEWLISDPQSDKALRSEALDTLIIVLVQAAKAQGTEFVFHMNKHPRLQDRLLDHGFVKGDTGMTMMIRRVL